MSKLSDISSLVGAFGPDQDIKTMHTHTNDRDTASAVNEPHFIDKSSS